MLVLKRVFLKDAACLLTIQSFLLTMELLCRFPRQGGWASLTLQRESDVPSLEILKSAPGRSSFPDTTPPLKLLHTLQNEELTGIRNSCLANFSSWSVLGEIFSGNSALIFLSLLFWISLLFCFSRNSLAFLSVFPFFSKDFRGSEETEILAFLVVFLAFSQKSKEKKIRVC